MLDVKTVLFSYVITNILTTFFLGLLWYRNRKRYAGLFLWLMDFILQALGLVLVLLREIAPDFVSIVIGNALSISGIILMLMGLGRFVGRPRRQIHNYFLLTGFVLSLSYFLFVRPDISIRTILGSAAIGLVTGQCAWLMLGRVDGSLKPIARPVGVVFLLFALVALVRVVILLLIPLPATSQLFQSPLVQLLFLMSYQILSITLTFVLILMVSRRLQRDLHLNEQKLQEKNAELTRFNQAVSHDLKSPLVTIRIFLDYLEEDALNRDAAKVNKDLAYIRTAADTMASLLDELLELSRSGHRENPYEEAPLKEIIQEALDLVAGRIAQRGVQVRVTEEPILIYGDRRRLVEVFQNLVDNAVKFMGDQADPRVEIGVEPVDDEIVLFVRDNGLGIDSRHQSILFGLFEKLDPHLEGTGLGLALVRRIVEAHGGRIWVESEGLGKGACFRFTLGKKVRSSS